MMNFVNTLKKQSRLFFAVLCAFLFFQTTSVSADPSNCEDCYFLPEDDIQDCLDDASCNVVPINGNIWVLGLAGLVLAYVVYRKRLTEDEQ